MGTYLNITRDISLKNFNVKVEYNHVDVTKELINGSYPNITQSVFDRKIISDSILNELCDCLDWESSGFLELDTLIDFIDEVDITDIEDGEDREWEMVVLNELKGIVSSHNELEKKYPNVDVYYNFSIG